MTVRKRALWAGCALLILSLSLAWATWMTRPLAVPNGGVVFLVTPGQSVQQIARSLQQAGLLNRPWWFVWQARCRGVSTRLHAGEYQLVPGVTVGGLLKQMAEGQVIQYPLTIVEGWTFDRLLETLTQSPKLVHALAGLTHEEIMARLGYPGQHPEGRFYPDTYYYTAGMDDISCLQRAYRVQAELMTDLWAKRDGGIPLRSPDEALVLASIIEKESAYLEEYADIAAVYLRRLNLSMPLQADPTVIYGMGKAYTGRLRYQDLRTDTPYNTYTRRGLPPTPIAMPSRLALYAALHPSTSQALYFVARQDGRHEFSETLEAHQAAVNLYQKKPQVAHEP